MSRFDTTPYLKGMNEDQAGQLEAFFRWVSRAGFNGSQIKVLARIRLDSQQMAAIYAALEDGLVVDPLDQRVKAQKLMMKALYILSLSLLVLMLSFSVNAESNILSLSSLQEEPPKAKVSRLVFNHDDTLINVAGALVRKKDAMNLFSSLYQKKTGQAIEVLDVFTTSNKQFLGCITLSQGSVDIFFTNGIEIFNKEDSQAVLGIQSGLAIDYYESLIKNLNNGQEEHFSKQENPKQEKKTALKTKEEERLLLFGQVAKKGLPLTKYFQYNKGSSSKKSVFIFVSHTCPNCIQYINTYLKHQNKFDAIANIKWVPIGSINNSDWTTFFRDEFVSFTKDEIERNQNIILSMNAALKKQTVTPTNVWLSKTVMGGVALVTGGLDAQDLDKVEKDLAD